MEPGRRPPTLISRHGGDVIALLLEGQCQVFEHLVRLGVGRGLDPFLHLDLHRVAGTGLDLDAAPAGFNAERAGRLDRKGLFDRAFDLGLENSWGGTEQPDADKNKQVGFHDGKNRLSGRITRLDGQSYSHFGRR